jgi:hypothetical protein
MSKVQTIKKHVKDHKEAYIAGAVCFIVGAAGALIIKGSQNTAIVDSFNMIKYKSPHTSQTLQVVLPQLGHPGNAVQIVGDPGTIFASQGAAARAFGVTPDVVSRHLRGEIPDVVGNVLTKLTERGVPIAE